MKMMLVVPHKNFPPKTFTVNYFFFLPKTTCTYFLTMIECRYQEGGHKMTNRKLTGLHSVREREKHDFYATDPQSTTLMLSKVHMEGNILEPNCGQGHISEVLKEYGHEVYSTDLIDRGYGEESGIDFLVHDYGKKFDNVVMNPPFKNIEMFIEKALEVSKGKVVVFARLQLLESAKRKVLFETTPLKKVLVHSTRQCAWKNGSPVDENGKRWASTQAYGWFIWEKGYKGKPTIEWI